MARFLPQPAATLPYNDGVIGELPQAHHLDVRVVTVTPAIAQSWLETSTGNRVISATSLRQYRHDISHGKWQLNGETLIFDKHGHLKNGHHRCKACIASGASFTTLVVWGVEPDSFTTMDRGNTRSPAAIFRLLGIDLPDVLSGATTLLHYWGNGDGTSLNNTSTAPTISERLDILEAHPDLLQSLGWRIGARPAGLTASQGVFSHYLLSRVDPMDADIFFRLLYDGAGDGWTTQSPVYWLRKILTTPKMTRDMEGKWRLIVTAWNLCRAGRPCGSYLRMPAERPKPQ